MLDAGQPVAAGDVHGQQVAARGPGRDAGRAADQRLALGAAGERDDDPLAGLPGRGDAVLFAVALQPLVDAVGQPEQGQLAQRGQVAGPEVVPQRGVDLVGRVDVAVRHPPAQRLGRHVDEFDLLGRPHDRVRHRLALRHAGDRLDDVVERLEVLDVDRADHVDAGLEQLPRRPASASRAPMPGTLVWASSSTSATCGCAGEHGRQVHLGELRCRGR